jgi:hypothetical protein
VFNLLSARAAQQIPSIVVKLIAEAPGVYAAIGGAKASVYAVPIAAAAAIPEPMAVPPVAAPAVPPAAVPPASRVPAMVAPTESMEVGMAVAEVHGMAVVAAVMTAAMMTTAMMAAVAVTAPRQGKHPCRGLFDPGGLARSVCSR